MLGCSRFRCAARRASSRAASGRALLVLGVLLVCCVPERALSSYTGGGSPVATVASATPGGMPDAGTELLLSDAGNSPQSDVVPVADAALPASLTCRDDCTCERHAARDFMFCGTAVAQGEAAARCRAAGGTLASVDDAALNDWLTARMQALNLDGVWLSGTDSEEEGVWRWADGRVFYEQRGDAGATGGFAPWQPTQPNDLNGEDCMLSVNGTWRDLACADELAFICQG